MLSASNETPWYIGGVIHNIFLILRRMEQDLRHKSHRAEESEELGKAWVDDIVLGKLEGEKETWADCIDFQVEQSN